MRSIKSKGFSLIELMIAMMIGIFLLAGISTSYVSSVSSNVKRNAYSALQDNGKIALEILRKHIGQAGYSPGRTTPNYKFITTDSPVVVDSCSDGTDNVLDIDATGLNYVTNSTFKIGVVHHGDNNSFTDCGGGELPPACRLNSILSVSPNPAGSKIYNMFYVSGQKLMCSGSRSKEPVVIAEGVEEINYLYGVDMVDDDVVKVDRFLTVYDIENKGNLWNNIVSVQIAVTVRSSKPILQEANKDIINVNNMTSYKLKDKYLRAVFTTTVNLRNTF